MNLERLKVPFKHPSVSFAAAAVLLSVGSALLTVEPLVGAGIMLLSGVPGWLGVRSREAKQENHKELTQRSRQLTMELETSTAALSIAKELSADATEHWLHAIGLWTHLDADGRVTLYQRGESGYRRRARYSPNLVFMNSGRLEIPLGQGILDLAHSRGEFVIDNLPFFKEAPDEYLSEQKKLGVTKSQCRELQMRSRSYVCFAFGREGARTRPYLLLFESTDANGLDSDSLRALVHLEAKRSFADLVDLGAHLDGASLSPVVH